MINRWMYRNSMKMLIWGGEDPRMLNYLNKRPAASDEMDIARASDNEKIKRAAHQLKAVARVWECVAPASNAHN
ncbi:MAG: hypothetical protein ACLRP3_05505 [Escherichia sp.]